MYYINWIKTVKTEQFIEIIGRRSRILQPRRTVLVQPQCNGQFKESQAKKPPFILQLLFGQSKQYFTRTCQPNRLSSQM